MSENSGKMQEFKGRFNDPESMKIYVDSTLKAKNISKSFKTFDLRMDDFRSAYFFGLTSKVVKYHDAICKFLDALQEKEFNALPETVKGDVWSLETFQSKAVIHARKVRELAALRKTFKAKEEELNHSLGKIPLSQRQVFNGLLVTLETALTESDEVESDEVESE